MQLELAPAPPEVVAPVCVCAVDGCQGQALVWSAVHGRLCARHRVSLCGADE